MVRHLPGSHRYQPGGPCRAKRSSLCGPSGSGKSTLIRCINALESYQKGEIVVDGIHLGSQAKAVDAVRREVGMVFQQFNLFPHMTVLENCMLAPMRFRGIAAPEAEDTARGARPGQNPGSGRQISRRNFRRSAAARGDRARALHGAQGMLFDEPTSALDPEMVKEVLDTMIGLATMA